MNIPVTSSAEKRGLPSSSLIETSTSSMSRSLLSLGGLAMRAVHDLLNQRNKFHARLVAALEALDRQVRVDVAQRVGAAFQFVVVLREPVSSCSRNFSPIRQAVEV